MVTDVSCLMNWSVDETKYLLKTSSDKCPLSF